MQTTDTNQTRPTRSSALPDSTPKLQPAPRTNGVVGQEQGVLYVGIDLGTSRTSVSASNGVRETRSISIGRSATA